MVAITLPDGSRKEFQQAAVTPRQVAESIGPRLARDAVGARVNGVLCDVDRPIEADATLSLITAKSADADAVYLLRHSTAHVMAEAIMRLFPQTKLAYGPPVEEGFFYDLELDHKLSEQDFAAIAACWRPHASRRPPRWSP